MLSFREIATSADDADPLQSCLQELQRRRQIKQQRRQHHRDACFTEEEAFLPAQELAYNREVLHVWTQKYPRLRSAIAALATTAFSDAHGSFHSSPDAPLSPFSASASVGAGVFSVAAAIKQSYPSLWIIPAGAIPASYYAHITAVDDPYPPSSAAAAKRRQYPLSPSTPSNGTANGSAVDASSSRRHQFPAGWAGSENRWDGAMRYSGRHCPVWIRREALQLPASPSPTATAAATQLASARSVTTTLTGCAPPNSVSSASPGAYTTQQKQRVLARWPQGKHVSAKVNAVLRSMDIEARKREQWNLHVQKSQQQQLQKENHHYANGRSKASNPTPEKALQTSLASFSVAGMTVSDSKSSSGDARRGSLTTMLTADAGGRELYWPAYITDVRAAFTGSACLRDNFQGLCLLQLYECFDEVLALALASPLQLVVDVVYAIDETSEGLDLPIDPIVVVDDCVPARETKDADNERRDRELAGASAYCPSFPEVTLQAPRENATAAAASTTTEYDERCPQLLPSTLPFVISDLNYSFQPVPPTFHRGSADTAAADARRRSSSVSPAATAIPEEVVTGTLHRSTLSTAPLSAYTILAGPVSESHSIVLLRPTPEVVCAVRARALQDLELRWKRLRQALIDQLVAYEEESPTPVAPIAEGSTGEAVDEERVSTMSRPVQILDSESSANPSMGQFGVQDEGLSPAPAGAVMLIEEELRRRSCLPELEGWRGQSLSPTQPVKDEGDVDNVCEHPLMSSRPASAQPAVAAASAQEVGCIDVGGQGAGESKPPLLSATPHTGGQLLMSDSGVEESPAAAAMAQSLLSISSPADRLPARRRSSYSSLRGGVDDTLKESTTAATVSAVTRLQQPYTPRLVAYAQQVCTKLQLPIGDECSSAAYSTLSSATRHRDEVSAPTMQPRSLADPQPAMTDLSSSANGGNTVDLSVERSRALSAAVRAAAAHQQEQEDALRRQQKPFAAPHYALPSITVEAPSPVSRGAPPFPSAACRDATQLQHQRVASVDIKHTAAVSSSLTFVSPPPPSALCTVLHEAKKGFAPFPLDTMETPTSRCDDPPVETDHRSTLAAKGGGGSSSSSSSSPARGGNVGGSHSSPLQLTPPQAKHLQPRPRFNERDELIVPSLSAAASSPLATCAAAAPVTTSFTNANRAAVGAESLAAFLSTPPPAAPPSHSSSPALRETVAQSRQRSPQSHASLPNVAELASTCQLLTTSRPHPEASSPSDTCRSSSGTASDFQRLSGTLPSPDGFSGTNTPPPFIATCASYGGGGMSQVSALKTGQRPSTSSLSNPAASSVPRSDVPQLRTTVVYSSAAAPHAATRVNGKHSALSGAPRIKTSLKSLQSASTPAQLSPRAALQSASLGSDVKDPAAAADVLPGRKASERLSPSPREQQHLGLRRPQAPQPSLDADQLRRRNVVLQSPRSLATSAVAAAAALAKSTAEAAAPHDDARHGKHSDSSAGHTPSAMAKANGVVGGDGVSPQGHPCAADNGSKDWVGLYIRGHSAAGVGEGFARKKSEDDANLDSPHPRKPSPAIEMPAPTFTEAPPARGHTQTDAYPQPLLVHTSDSSVQVAAHARHVHLQPHQPQRSGDHTHPSESSAILSASANREVELPSPTLSGKSNPLLVSEAGQRQQQQQQQPPAFMMLHRPPHPAASLHVIRALDDAELVRLCGLSHQHTHSGPAVAVDSEDKGRELLEDIRMKQTEKAAAQRTPRFDLQDDTQKDRGESRTHRQRSAGARIMRDKAVNSAPGKAPFTTASSARRVEDGDNASHRKMKAALSSHTPSRGSHHRSHKHRKHTAATQHRSPSPHLLQRSSSARHRESKNVERAVSSRSRSHRHRHRHRHHGSTRDLSNSDTGGVWFADTMAPTKVYPQRLQQLSSSPRASLNVTASEGSDDPRRCEDGLNSCERLRRSHRRRSEVRRDDAAHKACRQHVLSSLAAPCTTGSSSVSSRPRSRSSETSASSLRPIAARSASPVPLGGFVGPWTTSLAFHSARQSAARRSSRTQRTVLVRRVVPRCRREVFVEEGGSLVYRVPLAINGPSSASSRAPARSQSPRNVQGK
ncbi:hypothetical protein ABL78_7103 [Leptomonas seymouri]|uniref:Uncharacterized protein n=1 Tax=Leptomonas seymouri TaxID=5684 RepID=A0A0N1IHJ7_LEPSE|nr:hypothetical protein ABL78_7103 [Leptomonas seymouri]|eukprot:KPI83853.1 hypothetical protein ABL78_7103 [Leptomonas seymouri]